MKKYFAVIAALLVIACVSGCSKADEKEPSESLVTTTPDPNSMEVPDFSGLSRVQIEMTYPKLNIVFNEKYDDETEEDYFLAQSPEAGTMINKADEITVDISKGGKLVEVDDYTNRSIDDVRTLIEKQGLVCQVVIEENETVTRNCVIKTTPSARTKVEKGTTVTCYVSGGSGQQEIRVPDMVGKTIEDATKLATENGVALSISYDDDSTLEPGTVISQGLDPDTVVEPNAMIEVVISGMGASSMGKTNITVNIGSDYSASGEFELKYYIDGTLVAEKTETKEISLTKKIDWEVTGKDVHTYSIIVTSLTTGKSGKLYEMEVDFTQDPPKKDHHNTFNPNIFKELLKQ